MKQEARSERSRSQILAAALRLFSSQGYRGTNMREIAETAGVSTGNVYHQFKDKEELFQTLLTEYVNIQKSPDYPFNKAIAEGAFPNDIERLGLAIRESLEQTRAHAMLFYIDAIEFNGKHLRQFYVNVNERLEAYLQSERGRDCGKYLREGTNPLAAMQFTIRSLSRFFEIEVLFGVSDAYGRSSADVIRELTDFLSFGIRKS